MKIKKDKTIKDVLKQLRNMGVIADSQYQEIWNDYKKMKSALNVK